VSVLNFNQARKRKAKAKTAKQADENRITYGLNAGERKLAKSELDRQTKALDNLKIDK
jgi:hypothetical protein